MHTLGTSGNTVGIYGVEDAQNYDIVYNVYHPSCTWLLAYWLHLLFIFSVS